MSREGIACESVLVYMLYVDRIHEFKNVLVLVDHEDTFGFSYEPDPDNPTRRPEVVFYKANIAGIDVLKKKGT